MAIAPAFSTERLPYVVEPLPGEALDSWIEAYARQLIVTSHEFLTFIGLPGTHPERMLVKLLPEEAAVLARRTGVPSEALRAMTLEPFDQITVTVRHTTRGLGSPPRWRRHKGSRYCPTCLAETGGRWQRSWRSPWTFVCTRHAQLLVETCEGCGQRPHPAGRHPAGVTNPALCTMARDLARGSKGARLPCHTDLTTAVAEPIPADGQIIRAQHYVDTVIRGHTDRDRDPGQPRPSLEELFFLAWRGLATLHDDTLPIPQSASDLLHEAGGHALALLTGLSNETATDVAVGTALAMTVVERDHLHSDAVLRWIADSHLRKDGSMEVLLKFNSWRTSCSPATVTRALTVIDTRLRIIDRLRFATTSRTPQPPAAHPELIERRAAAIPATLWPSWSMRLMPHQIGGPRGAKVAEFRAGLSALLLVVRSTSRVYRDALALLGDPVPPSFVKSMITRLDRQHLTPLLAALTQLADALDDHGSPIDYQRRRSLADTGLVIDRQAYHRLAAQNRWRAPTDRSLDALDSYLRAMWTGTLTDTDHRLNDLRFHADPEVRAFLFDQAARHLNRLGIDEPVTWEPPFEWVRGIPWPGTEPADISAEEFRRTAARHHKLTDVADSLGIGIEHARLYAELASTIPTVHRKGRSLRMPRTTAPAAVTLHHLYVTQGLTLKNMGKVTGASVAVLKEALAQAGLALRVRGNRRHSNCIDREWLHEQYAVKHRSFADIAQEIGAAANTVRNIARREGIPLRGGASVPRDFAATTQGLVLSIDVYRAFCGGNAVERVRHVGLLLDHDSMATAAQAAGLCESDLKQKVTVVEKTTGIRLVGVFNPLALTAAGTQLLRQVKPVLDRYAPLHADSAAIPAVRTGTPRTTLPEAAVLEDLYVHQGLSLARVSRATGVSVRVVKEALQGAGIEIRKRGHRPNYSCDLDRDWLYEQYVVRHRTFVDIADEVGMVSTTVLNIARRKGIPLRSHLGVPRDFATTTQGLDIQPVVYRAFAGFNSVPRVRTVSSLLSHHTIENAAQAVDAKVPELLRMIAVTEKNAGLRLLLSERPLRLTAEGRALLHQVIPVLDRYGTVSPQDFTPCIHDAP
ncbi:TniQ family protein [Streptomyces sp. NPDC057257]|uniref:TniQ family protein n=1 Tax=Streptomyces sp. NPDC057257 TaxID=3346071 RepID=UPI003626BF60